MRPVSSCTSNCMGVSSGYGRYRAAGPQPAMPTAAPACARAHAGALTCISLRALRTRGLTQVKTLLDPDILSIPAGTDWRCNGAMNGGAEMRSKLLYLGVAAVLAQLAAGAAWAANDATVPVDERVVNLDTLVVVGVAPVASLTWVTDPRVPRQPVPASDGADYLKTVPGFATLRSGGTNGDPVLRGQFGSRLNLLAGDGALMGACPSRMDNAM